MKRIWENEQKVIIQTPKGVYFSNKHWALRLRNRVQTMKFRVWLKILKVKSIFHQIIIPYQVTL